MKHPLITFQQVHDVRTSGLPDAYWERQLGISRAAIQKARVGVTWKTHPTPPDTKPRTATPVRKSAPETFLPTSLVSRALANWPRVRIEIEQ